MSIVKLPTRAPALGHSIPNTPPELRLLAPLEAPSLGQRAGYLLGNPWKNFLVPSSWLRRLLSQSQSPLLAESLMRPGGWRAMEIMYQNAEPIDWLDRQALRDNPISMAARNRRRIVTGLLARLIARYSAETAVTLLGVGAGPGQHIQRAIVESGIGLERVRAYLVDRDDDAFANGRKLAASLGIAACVRFVKGDARRIREALPEISPQIVKLVGLIEYLTDGQLAALLHSLRRVMPPGGSLLTHGFVDVYGMRRFLARVFGLRHRRRSARQLTVLLESTGFKIVDCVVDPTGIHPIFTAAR
jgi:SAM-dependent methyltransferase